MVTVVVLPRRRRPRGRRGPVVGAYAEDPPLLGLGRHLIVDRGIVRRHHDVPGSVQVAGGVRRARSSVSAGLSSRPSIVGVIAGETSVDLRARLEQPRQPPLGDAAAADDHHAAAGRAAGRTGTARCSVTPSIPADSNVAISRSARTAQVTIG